MIHCIYIFSLVSHCPALQWSIKNSTEKQEEANKQRAQMSPLLCNGLTKKGRKRSSLKSKCSYAADNIMSRPMGHLMEIA